jgi:single-strand DNA-binding protein
MYSTNVTLVGNLTGDPELKFLADGVAVCNFSIAVNRRKFNKATNAFEDGDTSFYRVSAWRTLAENVAQTFVKGSRAIVTGELTIRNWEDGDKKGTSAELVADAAGPDLTWASAEITKNERKQMANAGAPTNGTSTEEAF